MDQQSWRLLTIWAVSTAGVIGAALMLRFMLATMLQAAGAI